MFYFEFEVGELNFSFNKDDNIHKSEAMKLYKSQSKIVSKFVAKLIKYMILFKDILTIIGLDYRDASLITSYLVVIGISI